MWYFAYGHNTNDSEMRKRLPNAKKVGKGWLQGYQLVLYKYATIELSDGGTPGVVWDLSPAELRVLDKYEEVPVVYLRRNVMVDVDGVQKKAVTYVMKTPLMGPPSKKYIQWLKVGYTKNRLV